MGIGTGFVVRLWEDTDLPVSVGSRRLCLFRGSSSLAIVPMGAGAGPGDSARMPCQTRLNLYATFVALLGFVVLAFSHA